MHSNSVETTISDEAIEWFSKLHSGQVTPEDRHRFEAWRQSSPAHAEAYTDVEQFWRLLDEPARRVFEQEEPRRRTRTGAIPSLRRAAWLMKASHRVLAGFALTLAAALWLGLPGAVRFWTSDYHTGWGERREFALQDGSRISLNTHSALSVDFSPELRRIELLEGEAYFQVARDPARPFVVVTAHGLAKVTGTAFNVYRQAERMTVTVSEGRVRVYVRGAEERAVELTAGLQASGDAHGIGPAVRVEARHASAWREGLLTFDLQPLSAVVDELNRYFPGRLMIADPRIRGRIVSGAFDLGHPRDALAAIEITLGLSTLELSDALILLYRPGF